MWYGPFHGELPASLNGVLDSYRDSLAFEPGGDEAYLFSPNDSFDRPLERRAPGPKDHPVKRMFQKHFGQEISPKALRSSFITWLRDSTTCPCICKPRQTPFRTKLRESAHWRSSNRQRNQQRKLLDTVPKIPSFWIRFRYCTVATRVSRGVGSGGGIGGGGGGGGGCGSSDAPCLGKVDQARCALVQLYSYDLERVGKVRVGNGFQIERWATCPPLTR